jgi:hypothetical protein
MMDVSGVVWRKSSHSGGNNDCVEMACASNARMVRDSKNVAGEALTFPVGAVRRLMDRIRQD